MNKIKSIVATLAILLATTACGVEPEETEIEQKQTRTVIETKEFRLNGAGSLRIQKGENNKAWALHFPETVVCIALPDISKLKYDILESDQITSLPYIVCGGQKNTLTVATTWSDI